MDQPFGALGSLRVLDLTDRWGQFAGRLLADLGADVVLGEPREGHESRRRWPVAGLPDGGTCSLYFWHFNQGKRSVLWEPGDAAGAGLAADLLGAADIVLAGRASYAEIIEQLPGVLSQTAFVVMSPYGLASPDPLREDDLHVSAASAMAGLSGYGSDARSSPVVPPAEQPMHSVGLYGAMTALLAVRLPGRGRGQLFDLSAQAAGFQGTEQAFPHAVYRGEELHRRSGGYATAHPTPGWQRTTADGRKVYCFGLLPRTQRAWDQLRQWMRESGGIEDLDEPRFDEIAKIRGRNSFDISADGAHVMEVIGRFVESLDAETVYREAQRIGIGWARIFYPEETLAEEQFAFRRFFRPTRWPGQDTTYLTPSLPWVRPDQDGSRDDEVAVDDGVAEPPLPGAHTAVVMQEWLGPGHKID
jgi:crotonobetainyl-CoA:carnitine CoA-transferase CaiB-like acyl-CoA transferase